MRHLQQSIIHLACIFLVYADVDRHTQQYWLTYIVHGLAYADNLKIMRDLRDASIPEKIKKACMPR